MASTHHHHHHHPPPPPPTTPTCYCHYSYTCCTQSPHPPPPPNPHLQPIPSHFPPQPHQFSPINPNDLHCNCNQAQYQPPPSHLQDQHFPNRRQQHHQQEETESQSVVFSLLRRITALESSLRRQFPAPRSLRDAAARTIQAYFRAFLVRRSRTLRQLKDLASIKSNLNALKVALSDDIDLDSQALSHGAMEMLLKLDSIQGVDPMIRDGKKSISRELIHFLELIDGVSVRRNGLSSRAVKNVRFVGNGNKSRVFRSGNERKLIEELRGKVEKIQDLSRACDEDMGLHKPSSSINGKSGISQSRNGILLKGYGGVQVQPKVKKNVSFADHGNASRVFRSTHEPVLFGDNDSSDGSGSIDGGERELMDNLCREVEEIRVLSKDAEEEEVGEMEDGGGSPQVSDGERSSRRILRAEGNYRGHLEEGENGGFVFSAPLPVKMESRADLMKKRNALKIGN